MPLSTVAVDGWDAEAAHELPWQINQPNVHKKPRHLHHQLVKVPKRFDTRSLPETLPNPQR
jgi:hypothetical protein